ncbi:MAG: hypothetical protein AAF108_00250 [Planctomycetota bacterium]
MRRLVKTWPWAVGVAAALCGPTVVAQVSPSTIGEARPDGSDRATPDSDRREIVIRLRDGRFLSGVLLEERDDGVRVRIAGTEIDFASRRIDRYEILPPIDVRYRSWREQLREGDHEGRLLLADWLRARGRFEDALAEVGVVLEAVPDSEAARSLERRVRAQVNLLRARERRARAAGAASLPSRREAPPLRDRLLDDEGINTLRVFEVPLDGTARIDIDPGVVDALRERAPDHPSVLALPDRVRDNPAAVLRAVFDLRARELYPKVRVLDDPEPIARFIADVHRPWLLNSCATTRCHGGADAGRLSLAPRASNAEAVAYTNFLLLHRARTSDDRPMIDDAEPAASPILQAALPRNQSIRPHPAVGGWRPAIGSTNDRRFRDAVAWIRSLQRPRPDYPIDFEWTGPRVRERRPVRPSEPVLKPVLKEKASSDQTPSNQTPSNQAPSEKSPAEKSPRD